MRHSFEGLACFEREEEVLSFKQAKTGFEELRARQAKALCDLVEKENLGESGGFTVMCGDFNDVPLPWRQRR